MVLTVIILIIIDITVFSEPKYPIADELIRPFAKSHNIRMKEYPDELKAMLEKNPETEDFVLNYPLKKDAQGDFSMEEYKNSLSELYQKRNSRSFSMDDIFINVLQSAALCDIIVLIS